MLNNVLHPAPRQDGRGAAFIRAGRAARVKRALSHSTLDSELESRRFRQ